MNFGTERSWKKKISDIKKEVGEAKYPFPGFIKNMILRDHLYLLIEDKIIQFCENKKVGILFSGGVDSAVLVMFCKKLNLNYCCYSVGFQDNETKQPEDIEYSKIIAQKHDLNLKFKVFNLKEIEVVIKKTLKILSKNKDTFDVVNLGVGAVELAAIEMAKKDKCDIVLSGLGSEEIFAGYQRHKNAKDKEQECWNGLTLMYKRDLIRETLIPKVLGIETYAPFLDFDVIGVAMHISIKAKINKRQNKIVIRKIAKKLGLKEFSNRKKRAAQYGSRFHNAIDKLSSKAGFKLKKDYIKNLIK